MAYQHLNNHLECHNNGLLKLQQPPGTHTHTHIYIYIYLYTHIYIFRCEKTTQYNSESERMCSCQEAQTDKNKKICKSNKEAAGVLRRMNWPRKSPDLNITECVWNYVDHKKQKMQPTSETKLWRCEKISLQIAKEVVIKVKCGHTTILIM